jgi:hypothetical protein
MDVCGRVHVLHFCGVGSLLSQKVMPVSLVTRFPELSRTSQGTLRKLL